MVGPRSELGWVACSCQWGRRDQTSATTTSQAIALGGWPHQAAAGADPRFLFTVIMPRAIYQSRERLSINVRWSQGHRMWIFALAGNSSIAPTSGCLERSFASLATLSSWGKRFGPRPDRRSRPLPARTVLHSRNEASRGENVGSRQVEHPVDGHDHRPVGFGHTHFFHFRIL